MESRYLDRLIRSIRLMELRRLLNYSTRYSVGVEFFLILRRSVFLLDIVQYCEITGSPFSAKAAKKCGKCIQQASKWRPTF